MAAVFTVGGRFHRVMTEKKQDYVWIVLGTFIMALSANLCFTPSHVVPGGFTGLAIIIKYVSEGLVKGGIPTWLSNIMLNIPLVLMAIKVRGWRFMKRTFAATLSFSLWLLILPEYPLTGNDLFLTAVIGGVGMGAGLGYVFLGKATTGGTDTVGAILQRAFPHMSTAALMKFLDAAVILLSVGIFGLRVSVYAAISVFIMSFVADYVTSGSRNAYFAHIISAKYEEIADCIMEEMDRGVTMLNGCGMYTKKDRPVLLCAVSKKQAVVLRELVADIDPKAFLILTDAREIRGEGFLDYSREEL